jgi:hypothetical protein
MIEGAANGKPVEGEQFTDGHMADVMRVGDRVVRSRSPWSDASHAVLRYLEDHGYSGAPRLIDVDDEREVLSFVPGESIPADLDGYRDDDTLVSVAGAIRDLHRALEGFRPPKDLAFPQMPGAPTGGSLVCHNDLAPWNTIMRRHTFAAFIDWDLVTLATAAWDIAYAAWCFVPLYADDVTFGAIDERARRLRLLLGVYGLPNRERRGFIDLIGQRQRCAYETAEQWGQAGVPGFDRLYRQRLHVGALADIAWLDAHRAELQRAVDPSCS